MAGRPSLLDSSRFFPVANRGGGEQLRRQEIIDSCRDLFAMSFQSEVASVKETDFVMG
jgi:hypothetical protein